MPFLNLFYIMHKHSRKHNKKNYFENHINHHIRLFSKFSAQQLCSVFNSFFTSLFPDIPLIYTFNTILPSVFFFYKSNEIKKPNKRNGTKKNQTRIWFQSMQISLLSYYFLTSSRFCRCCGRYGCRRRRRCPCWWSKSTEIKPPQLPPWKYKKNTISSKLTVHAFFFLFSIVNWFGVFACANSMRVYVCVCWNRFVA